MSTASHPRSPIIPRTDEQWKAGIDQLPATPDKIPAFFFSHGSPMLQWPESAPQRIGKVAEYTGPHGPLARFLKVFGPAVLEKYKPKGILVFSAHWETKHERLVTDYGENQPLLMDYYGFHEELYKLEFVSNGSHALSQRVVEVFKEAGQRARLSPASEARGEDGRGFLGPGLDHGVFVPFRLMFGHVFESVPIVEASIDHSLSPQAHWEIGKAVAKLREEGILILSGGLMIHTFQDFSAFAEDSAKPIYKEFDRAIMDSVLSSNENRKAALIDLTKHRGFRAAHPREEHFIPIYVAAGAGEGGDARAVSGIYGSPTFAFGL